MANLCFPRARLQSAFRARKTMSANFAARGNCAPRKSTAPGLSRRALLPSLRLSARPQSLSAARSWRSSAARKRCFFVRRIIFLPESPRHRRYTSQSPLFLRRLWGEALRWRSAACCSLRPSHLRGISPAMHPTRISPAALAQIESPFFGGHPMEVGFPQTPFQSVAAESFQNIFFLLRRAQH